MNHTPDHTHVEPQSGMLTRLSTFNRFWQRLINWPIDVEHTHEYEVQYFMQGKVMLLVEHPNDLARTGQTLADVLSEFLNQPDREGAWQNRLVPPKPEAIITFPPRENGDLVLSMVPVRLRNENASQEELIKLLTDIDNDLQEQTQGQEQEQKQERRRLTIKDRTTLNSVAPDWLIGNAGHNGPHPPSPGSWPVRGPSPSPDERQVWLITEKPNPTSQPNTSRLPFADGKGAGIDIAILDTAPLKVNRDEAYEKWKSDPLIADLLRPNGAKLTVHTGIYADVELADYSVVGHPYRMPDHGLFIAGIIHNIAPEADLHVFKAFTDDGSSSSEAIANGINLILKTFRNPNDTPEQKKRRRPLIVHCSFGLDLHDDNSGLTEQIKGMTKSLEEVFNQLITQDRVIVVAAAGNHIGESPRPPATFPAAFKNVIGVGALPKASSITPSEHKAASYSNLSDDRNPDEGFMIFGGEPGYGNGVHSIYISEFPVYAEGCISYLWRKLTGTGFDGWKGPGHIPPDPKTLGISRVRYEVHDKPYAYWAGTSFAAPHITGIVANWCSQPADSRAPGDPVHQRINIDNVKWALSGLSRGGITNQNEPVVRVVQGPLPL